MGLVHRCSLCDMQRDIPEMFLVSYITELSRSRTRALSHRHRTAGSLLDLCCVGWVVTDTCGPTAKAVAFCPRRGPRHGTAVQFGDIVAPKSSI